MNRKTTRATKHWSDRTQARELAPRSPQPPRPAHETNDRREIETGLGPYEASYDVSLGYGHERAIVLP